MAVPVMVSNLSQKHDWYFKVDGIMDTSSLLSNDDGQLYG